MDQGDAVKRPPHPREKANPVSVLTFFYTRKLFHRGFKKDLEDDDLYDVVKSCRSKKCTDKLEHAYQAEQKKKNPSLLRVLWNCYGLTYMILGILSLSFKLLSSTLDPDAIANLVAYFKPGQTKLSFNDALYYAGVLISLKVIENLYSPNYHLYLYQLSLQIRASFSSLIYRKSLKLSPKSLEKTSVGNIVTIISKDVSMFEGAIHLFNNLWIGVIQIFYICYLIYARVGASSTLGVLILASSIPIQFLVSKLIGKLRTKINKRTDVRLQESQEALSTIKIIKMYTWEKIFIDRISESRRKEIKTMLKKSVTRITLIVTSELLGNVGFYVIVMLYIYYNTNANAESIFYIMRSYSTLSMVISFVFSFGLTFTAELSASLARINNVLQLEELPDHVEKVDDKPLIDIRNASVNLKDNDILKSVSLKFEAGLNIISGQLGSGKSSLVKLILRDFIPDAGEVRSRGRISYASQDPWLFPATIKQNILFGEKYEYTRYNKVVEVCALAYDFSILDKGDDTVVLDRGMNLSKGQQARINLARAIYKESDIYLLDDVLTALDSKVQDHIFRECIEEFLQGKLVVLVTHNSKHINKSDKLLVLDKGAVSFVGSGRNISEDILQAIEDIKDLPAPTPQPDDKEKLFDESAPLIEPPAEQKKQIYHENKKQGAVSLQTYANYIKLGGGVLMVIGMVLLYASHTFADSSAQVMLTNWVNYQSNLTSIKEKQFGNTSLNTDELFSLYFLNNSRNITTNERYDIMAYIDSVQSSIPNAMAANPSQTIPLIPPKPKPTAYFNSTGHNLNFSNLTAEQNQTLAVFAELENLELMASRSLNLYTVTLIAAIVVDFVKNYMIYHFGNNASLNLHKSMIKSIMYAKMSFFDTFLLGNILNRFSQDLNVVDEYLSLMFGLLISASFGVLGIIGMMAHVNLKFIIPAVAILIVLLIMRFIYMPTARSLKRLEAATRSPIIGHLNSSMEGLTTVRAFKAQEILKNEFDKHQDVYISAKYTSICASNAFAFYMDFSAVILNLFVICRFLFFDTDTQSGDVGLTLTQVSALTMIVQFALLQWSEVENMMTSVERVMEYTAVEPEKSEGTRAKDWPSDGEVIYHNVSLTYTNSTDKVLSNINFAVKPKEKIGIVGRTGAGKSSIISTLFRLYNHDGTITIDGIDTKTLALDHLRQHISIIPQDPIMFSGTVRTNIDPLKEFTDEEIWKVLHKVNLDNKVPNLDSSCDDTNFSSGERQLLSLSRAIIRKNKIVVLDEATANMDPETEGMVQKAIDSNFSDCTVFIIAHRLDCIINCDKVIVLDRGEIKEFDEPRALLKDESSQFSIMMKASKSSS
ncbi:unnamed protein product [Phyllotreta striolata]|uniref:Uncharacterized protein n=1 Tax=Phyllotreta striolata TaxID=444603 RepID=A0A9N9TTK8_PHYSR|nr:unnamed protein product [Phyllotreta striolata]